MQPHYEHLYLKEYFTNFFIRKNHQEQTSLLKSSLEVLSQLATNFINTHAISYQKDPSCYLSQQQLTLQNVFQELYFQIKTVFEWVDQNGKHLDDSRFSLNLERDALSMMMVGSDDELYGILNEYKIENKKLRSENKDLQSRIQKIEKQSRKNENLLKQEQEQYERKIEVLGQECAELLKRVQALNIENEQKQHESLELQKKIYELESQLQIKESEVSVLEHDLEQKNREMDKMKKQFSEKQKEIKSISAEYEEKMRQIKQKIPKMINQQLHSSKSWQMPVYQGLLKYIKTTTHLKSQQNINPNH